MGYTGAFYSGTQTLIWTQQGLLLNAAVLACWSVPPAMNYANIRTIEIVYSTRAPYSTSGEPVSASYPCWLCSTTKMASSSFGNR
jgi:hypothetical protein